MGSGAMRGVFTALITPFDDRGELDLAAFRAILEDQRAAGVAGVVPCGTTGESPTLSRDEKKALIGTAIETLKGSGVRVIAGTGSNDTRATVELSRWAGEQGADGVLVVTPYYNKPSQAGLEAHYRAVADAAGCEVMLYNVPGRTGVSLTAATIASLARHPRIRSLKEATANVAFASEILGAAPGLSLLSGDDGAFLPLLSVGASGIVSVASNLFPRAMVAIQRAFESGDTAGARAIHQRYSPLFRDLFVESNPTPVKHAMARAGFCGGALRLPLVPLAPASVDILEKSLSACGVARGARL
jgi:4-hydroxy-tetrahydrodipicolinate synthase